MQAEGLQDEHGNPVPGWEMLIGAVRVMPDEEDEMTGERHRAQVQHRPQMTMEPHNFAAAAIGCAGIWGDGHPDPLLGCGAGF